MIKVINILFLLVVLIFFLSTYNFYSSNKILKQKILIENIDEIISTKISNLPILGNDTDDVIVFNDGFSNEIKIKNQEVFGIY